jgi:hypothetical protein
VEFEQATHHFLTPALYHGETAFCLHEQPQPCCKKAPPCAFLFLSSLTLLAGHIMPYSRFGMLYDSEQHRAAKQYFCIRLPQ